MHNSDMARIRPLPWTGNIEVQWFAWLPTRYSRTASVGWMMYRRGDVEQGPLHGGSRDVEDPDDPAAVLSALAELVAEARAACRAHTERQVCAMADQLAQLG